MNSNDRLCLDGQRLLLQSGTYGAEGATYTTEQHNGSKIIGTALTGSNARSFKVYTKAGEIMEYTPFNIPANNLALQFVLSKVTDAKSNYWQVHYQSNIAQGEIYPKAICYTGNSRLNQVPKNCIEFGYGADTSRYTTPIVRNDASLGFGAGFAFLSSQRLSGIRTLINATATPSGNSWTIAGTPVTDYKLTYSAFNPIDRTLLKSVEECSPTACLTAQTFLYNEQGSIALENTNGNYNPPYPYLWGGVPQTADFNGDGRTDFFIVTGSPSTNLLSILISKEDGTFADTFTNYPKDYSDGTQPAPYPPLMWLGNFSADFNGDGKTDLISLTWAPNCGDGVASSTYQVWLSNGDGTFNIQPQQPVLGGYLDCSGKPTNITTGDYNLDGIQDLYLDGHILFFNSSGAVGNVSMSQRVYNPTVRATNQGDFTGDGIPDIIDFYANGTAVVSAGDGTGKFNPLPAFASTVHGINDSNYRLYYSDFNGDGKIDILHLGSATDIKVWLSKGDGSFEVKPAAPGQTLDASLNNYRFFTGDFNGDGLTDLVHAQTPTQLQYWIAVGDGTFRLPAVYTNSSYNFSTNNYNLQVADVNGDGKSDLIHTAQPPYFRALLTTPSNVATSKLKEASNGAIFVRPTYGYLSSHPNYQPSVTAPVDQVVVKGALPIVTALASSNGLNNAYNTQTFKYGTALTETRTGRGFLGFAWQETQTTGSDGVLSPISRTTYSQTWPCVGMPVQSQVKLPNGGLRSQTDSVIRVRTRTSASPVECGNASLNGQSIIPFVADSVSRTWEVTPTSQQGTELPRQKMLTTLDANGNATRIEEQTLNPNGSASGYSRVTTNTYDPDPERARQGRLISSQVSHMQP